ncbi:MAG: hypothetical protein Q4D89_04115 [Arachnia propionica]|uniref:hypothetical protein n=1 Tax=Arachnia propionica TaxID=1750 RepID=UPI0026FA0B8B|nr:hypothetical protein [Arachnia propionica]
MRGEHRVTGATRRARQMMVGGLVAGHALGMVVCGLALTAGGAALVGALLGFAAVVIFFSIGQAIEIVACELEPVQGMAIVLASYAIRVTGVGAGLWFLVGHPTIGPAIDRYWMVAAVIVTVLAWTSGVVVTASRQRVPVYDIHDD